MDAGVRLLAALALALLCGPAHAVQYTCFPGIYGETLAYTKPTRTNAGSAGGYYFAHLCMHDGKVYSQTLACVTGTCSQSAAYYVLDRVVKAADPRAQMATETSTLTSCRTATGDLKAVCDEASAAAKSLYDEWKAKQPQPPPAEVWKVAPNGTSTTRPTYTVVNGALVTAAARAPVGATCDMAVKFVKGASTYAAWEPTKATVTLCRKV